MDLDGARLHLRLHPWLLAWLSGATLLAACGVVPPSPGPAPTPTPTSSPGSTVISPSPAQPSPPPPSAPSPSGTVSASARTPGTAATCAGRAAALSTPELVGQLLMVAVPSSGLSTSDARRLSDSRAGSVVLLGNTSAGVRSVRRVVDRAREAVREPDGVRVLVAVDQEGGQVQRLAGPEFSDMPSARAQAELSDRDLRERSASWAAELRRAGVDANLAPVADVVPVDLRESNRPIGALRRDYGADPDVVAAKVRAYVDGMQDGQLLTAVKHYPGLGRVRGNTDFATRVVDDTTTREDPEQRGFVAARDAGVDMVMMSSAIYTRIDPDRRAAHSWRIVTEMLRGDLGFDGVVISDDLAAAAMRDLSPGQRALRFLRAGGDLMIVGDPRLVAEMVDRVVTESENYPRFAAELRAKAARVLVLKTRGGLAACSD